MVESGAGGGNTASHLKARAHLTLADIAPAMLALSARLNPACGHIEASCGRSELGRAFDAVLLHEAVMYMTTEDELEPPWRLPSSIFAPEGQSSWVPGFPARNSGRRRDTAGTTAPTGDLSVISSGQMTRTPPTRQW